MTGTTSAATRTRRERAAELHATEARARRRGRSRNRATAVLAAILLAGGVGMAVQTQRDQPSSNSAAPSGLDADTGFAIGSASAPVTIEIYEDFLCPACKRFEDQAEATIASLLGQDRVRVVYRVISILDRASTTDYSTRSMNAAGCVGPSGFTALHTALYAEQPAEGGPGLPDERLIAIARAAGADAAVDQCIRDVRYRAWTANATETSSRRGVVGTPTILVDGTPLSDRTPAGLLAAVAAAS